MPKQPISKRARADIAGGRIVLMGGVAPALVRDRPRGDASSCRSSIRPFRRRWRSPRRCAIFPVHWLMRDPYRSDLAISDVHIPVLVLHGDADDIVPISLARQLSNSPTSRSVILVFRWQTSWCSGLAEVSVSASGSTRSRRRAWSTVTHDNERLVPRRLGKEFFFHMDRTRHPQQMPRHMRTIRGGGARFLARHLPIPLQCDLEDIPSLGGSIANRARHLAVIRFPADCNRRSRGPESSG